MWFPYTVPGGLSVSTSIIRVSFSASLNLLLICSIWQLIKLVDALASHIQMYWLETSDDSFKLSSKVSAFHVNANFDPDLINSWCHVPIRKLETQVLLSLACFFAYNQGKLNGIFFLPHGAADAAAAKFWMLQSWFSKAASKFAKLLMHILSFFSLEFREEFCHCGELLLYFIHFQYNI